MIEYGKCWSIVIDMPPSYIKTLINILLFSIINNMVFNNNLYFLYNIFILSLILMEFINYYN